MGVLATLPDWEREKLECRARQYFGQKENIAKKIVERHSKSDFLSIVLMFCYEEVFKSHGKLIPTINSEEKTQTNQMGIMFTDEIDNNYLSEIESLFLEDSYEYKFYDYLRYHNIGDIDIDIIRNKYNGLNLSTIRDITLYSKNPSIRDKFFHYLNDKSSEFQKDFCKLITPISTEVTTDLRMYNDGDFVDIIVNLINDNVNSEDQIIKTYERIKREEQQMIDTENYARRNSYPRQKLIKHIENPFIKTKNIFYICEFEYFFQELIINYLKHLDDEYLNILLSIKDYFLNNIPKATGERWRKRIYKEVNASYVDKVSACVVDAVATKFVGYNEGSNINFNKKRVYEQQKAIIEIVKMYFDKDIDYKKILELNCPDISNELIEVINSKEKVKRICK